MRLPHSHTRHPERLVVDGLAFLRGAARRHGVIAG
jgi:hypothetical protein